MTRHRPLDGVRDHRTLFTQDELRRAYRLVIDDDLAETRAADAYDQAEGEDQCVFTSDTFNLLCLVSDDVARRVQALLNETDAEAASRLAEFRTRLRLRADR